MDVIKTLKAARKHLGYSQSELGVLSAMPQSHISKIEANSISPRLNTLEDLVRIMGFELMLIPKENVHLAKHLAASALESYPNPEPHEVEYSQGSFKYTASEETLES